MRNVFSFDDVRSGLLIAASIGLAMWAIANAGLATMTALVHPFVSAVSH